LHRVLNHYKRALEDHLTEDHLNKVKLELMQRKEKLKLTEQIELDDLKNNMTEK